MASELRRLLLGIAPPDKQSRQLHKDLQQQKNRAPDTIATIVVAGLKNDQESKVRAIAHAISGFCSAGKAKLCRRFPQLYPIETREQGELDCLEVAIAQGDHSTPTLERFVKEVDENIAVLTEMREAAITELYAPKAAA